MALLSTLQFWSYFAIINSFIWPIFFISLHFISPF
jgi:hypothetical protein